MNKINFTAKDNFPLSSDTMNLMQSMTQLSAVTALIGGTNYVLSGCADDGTGNISDGVIVINGELLPFQGGAKDAKITIQETSKTLTALGEDYPEAYIYRVAKFSVSGEYNWVDFVRVMTNRQLNDKIDSLKSESPGFVKMWSGLMNRLEDKYLPADGRTVNTSDYPDLAYFYGKEGDSSFRLPDLRAKFVAGYDNAKEDYDTIGKTGGSEKVILTENQMPKHTHMYTDDVYARGKFPNIETGFPKVYDNTEANSSASSSGTGSAYYTTESGKSEEHENRPPFYVLAYVVRVKY
jgi:microcystin-dependent protein